MSETDNINDTIQDMSSIKEAAPQEHRSSATGKGRGRANAYTASCNSARAALHGTSNRVEHRSDTRGRWGKAPLPLRGSAHQSRNVRQLGFVSGVEGASGFIKCLTGFRELIPFETSEVQHTKDGTCDAETSCDLAPETPVEFSVEPTINGAGFTAKLIQVVPKFVDTTQQGFIERELRGGHKRREESYGARIAWHPPRLSHTHDDTLQLDAPPGLLQPQTGDVPDDSSEHKTLSMMRVKTSAQHREKHPPAGAHTDGHQPFSIPFEGMDTEEDCGRMPVGQPVSFTLVYDARSNQLRAHQVSSMQAAPSEPAAEPVAASTHSARQMGHVVTLKEKYGFILCATSERRLFFHFSEAGFPLHQLAEGAEVSFAVSADNESRREAAVALQLLQPGTIASSADEEQPGIMTGRVISPPSESATCSVMDGVAAYTDPESGLEFHCSFGGHQLPPGEAAVEKGDEVDLKVVVNTRTGARRASHLTAITRLGTRLEFGKVVTLKSKWGLLHIPGRPLDVFFSFTSLEPPLQASDLDKGDELQFHVIRDSETHKPTATSIARAPPGTLPAEETVGKEILTGHVEQRLTFSRDTMAQPGIISCDNPTLGLPIKLPFGPRDLADGGLIPGVGDQVSFQLATNHSAVKAGQSVGGKVALHAGRRATNVSLPQFAGHVVNVKPSFAFADVQPVTADSTEEGKDPTGEPLRVYFQTAEVVDKVQLHVGDGVEMVLSTDTRSGNRTGRRVHRTSQATALPTDAAATATQPAHSGKERKTAFVAERNPNATKYIGHKAELQSIREVKGPDGTRGFQAGPWCATRMAARTPPPAPAPSQPVSQPTTKAVKVPRDIPSSRRSSGQQQKKAQGGNKQPHRLAYPPLAILQQPGFYNPYLPYSHQQPAVFPVPDMLSEQQHQEQRAGGRPPTAKLAHPIQSQAQPSAFGAYSAPPHFGAASTAPPSALPRKLSSGRLSATAAAFVPRSASGTLLPDSAGSSPSDLRAGAPPPPSGERGPVGDLHTSDSTQFLTPAASLDLSGSEAPNSRASTVASEQSPSFASQPQQLHRVTSSRRSLLNRVQSEAFFTPAASLAHPVPDSQDLSNSDADDGLPNALQIQEAAARVALLRVDTSSDAASL